MKAVDFQELASTAWFAAANEALDYLLARAEREDAKAPPTESACPASVGPADGTLDNVSLRWNPVSGIYTLELSFADASMSFIPLRRGLTPNQVSDALNDAAACIGG